MCITEMRDNKVHCTEKIMDAEIRNYLCWIPHVFLYFFISSPFLCKESWKFLNQLQIAFPIFLSTAILSEHPLYIGRIQEIFLNLMLSM